MMQRKQRLSDKQLDETISDLIDNPRIKTRVTSLAPYIAEIQRRKKLRDLAKQSKKNLNQSSSRSFRIKEKSLTSLHKEALLKTRQTTTNSVISKMLENRAMRDQRTKSIQRHRDLEYSKTVENRAKGTPSPTSNTFFNDLYGKVKKRVEKAEKEPTLRRGKYETIDAPRSRSQQAGDINIGKIRQTNTIQIREAGQEQKKGKFRRNKFEVESQPTLLLGRNQAECSETGEIEEPNVGVNQRIDRQASDQIEKYYREVRKKEIDRSVEKSNQKYFSIQPEKAVKSTHDIQSNSVAIVVFVDRVKNPTPKKELPQSLSEEKTWGKNQHAYDFGFTIEQENLLNLGYIEDDDDEDQQAFSIHGSEIKLDERRR